MPSILPMDKINQTGGKLYIVATPIGNMDDITLRAIRVLSEVDLIAAEDTRKTGKLLSHHKIKGRLTSFHEHNEIERTKSILEKLATGSSVALVSDAGTPIVSDPGFRLVQAAIENNIRLIPIPGPSAAIAALSVSGFSTDSFLFVGFLPKKKGKREERLRTLANEHVTIIMYESPKRILSLMEEVLMIFGDRYSMVAREMTKQYEEFQQGMLSEIIVNMGQRKTIKGECTFLISGKKEDKTLSMEDARKEMAEKLKTSKISTSGLAKEIAGKYGFARSEIYKEIIKLKKSGA